MQHILKTNKALLALLFVCYASLSASAQKYPYQNPDLSAKERAKDLCSRLTLEEKAMLMLDESPAIPRLGIKKFFWWSEALHGAANMGNVTNFPEPVGMAASFNPALLYKVFDIASTEFRAQYNHRMYDLGGEDMKMRSLSVWTPNVNIFRDPRWGRGQETYGEDPYLTSVMGVQVVKGLQGPEDARYRKLWACAKHYAVHSGPEYTRHTANLTDVPVRDFWETYMPAFKTLVKDAKVREVMCAYPVVPSAISTRTTSRRQVPSMLLPRPRWQVPTWSVASAMPIRVSPRQYSVDSSPRQRSTSTSSVCSKVVSIWARWMIPNSWSGLRSPTLPCLRKPLHR